MLTLILSAMLILQTVVPYSMDVTYAEESTESGEKKADEGFEKDDQDLEKGDDTEEPSAATEPDDTAPSDSIGPVIEEPTESAPTETAPSETDPSETDPGNEGPVLGGGLSIVDDGNDMICADDILCGDDYKNPSENETPSENRSPSDNVVPKEPKYVYELGFDLKVTGDYTSDVDVSENKIRFGKDKHHVYVDRASLEISPSINKIDSVDLTKDFEYFIEFTSDKGNGTISANNNGNKISISDYALKEALGGEDFEALDIRFVNIFANSKMLDKQTGLPFYKIIWDGDTDLGDPSIWHFDDKDVEIGLEKEHEINDRIYVSKGTQLKITAYSPHLASFSATVSEMSLVSENKGDSTTYTCNVHEPNSDSGDVMAPEELSVLCDKVGEFELLVNTTKLMPGDPQTDSYILRVTDSGITVDNTFYGVEDGEKNNGREYDGTTYYKGDVVAEVVASGGAIDNFSYANPYTVITRKDGGSSKDLSSGQEWNEGSRVMYFKDESVIADGNTSSHDVSYKVRDILGNTGTGKSKRVAADHSDPEVSMTFEKENGDSAGADGIYNETVKGEAIVSDEDGHMTPALTELDADGASAAGWQTAEDGKSIYNTLTFSKDGKYNVKLDAEDMAGRKAEKAEFGTLIIDKTAPKVSIRFTGVKPENEFYYASRRQAIITVEDANFDPEGVTVEAMEGREDWYSDEIPEVGSWSVDEENGTATASIYFDKDGDYGFAVQAVDKAGNESDKVESGRFVIDTTAPELKITGVEDHSANRGRVAPVIVFSDHNLKLDDQKIVIKGTKNGEIHPVYQRETVPEGFLIRYDNFAETKDMDDVYTMDVDIRDLAGNTANHTIRFSVNRFGSTFMLSDDTEALVDKYYTRKAPTVTITEVNVDPIAKRDVSRSKDGTISVLKTGRDYTVKASDEGSWHSYEYTIKKDNFEDDGNYAVEIYTEDEAENRMDNGARGNEVKFAVDGTVPSIAVSGLRKNGTYEGSTHSVAFDAKDNISLKKVAVFVDGEEFTAYDTETLTESDGKEKFVLTENEEPRVVELRATDQAGNMLIKKYTNVLVTSDAAAIKERRASSDIVGNIIDVISQKDEKKGNVVNMVYAALAGVLVLFAILGGALLYRRTYGVKSES